MILEFWDRNCFELMVQSSMLELDFLWLKNCFRLIVIYFSRCQLLEELPQIIGGKTNKKIKTMMIRRMCLYLIICILEEILMINEFLIKKKSMQFQLVVNSNN